MADWDMITPARKRAIRAEMLRRWKQKLRKKGAAKAAGGDPTKTSGVDKTGKKYGTGSLKGWTTSTGQRLTADEIRYAKTVRASQKKSGKIGGKSRKVIAKTARATGAGNKKLVTAMSMKGKKQGGTVSFGSHKGDAGKKAAAAWRRKHLKAAGSDQTKIDKIRRRYKHMRGIKTKTT
tara:strand:- start:44 stop:577 length:534 start_codon:yes stop_codon:yes gene_type:complete